MMEKAPTKSTCAVTFGRKSGVSWAAFPSPLNWSPPNYCALDPATRAAAKAILLSALAYFIMPVDLVPDFIAALGFTDDAAVLYMAVNKVRQYICPEHRQRARDFLDKA